MRRHIQLLSCLAGAVAASVAGAAPAADLRVSVVDPSGRAVVNAIVYATPLLHKVSGSPPKATIDQVDRHFVPNVIAIQTDTAVEFPNSDNIRHSVYSFSPAKTFTLKLYSGKPAAPVVFDKPGIVVLGCNIHDSMVAWVLVVSTPNFARTAADGTTTLTALEPGDYVLRAWNNSMAKEQAGEPLHVDAQPLPARVLQVDGPTVDGQAMEPMH